VRPSRTGRLSISGKPGPVVAYPPNNDPCWDDHHDDFTPPGPVQVENATSRRILDGGKDFEDRQDMAIEYKLNC